LDPKCVEMPYHKRHLEDEKWERPWKTNMVSEPTNGESKRLNDGGDPLLFGLEA
jgi:hypothetical protein